jgi:hypothetical protein
MDADNSQLPPVPVWRWLLRLVVLMLQVIIVYTQPSMKNYLINDVLQVDFNKQKGLQSEYFFGL